MKKILILSLFFLTSVFIGYENPFLIEVPKKYIKFYLKNINLIDDFIVDENELKQIENDKFDIENDNQLIVEGNSFRLVLKKKVNFDDRTAGFYIDKFGNDSLEFDIYLQNGVNIKNKRTKEIFLPQDITFDQNGGVKSTFKFNDRTFILTSNKKINCSYAKIYDLENKNTVLKTKCLPDIDNVDFNGLGGAVVEKDNYVYISIGAPEWNSKEISLLAQTSESFFGKIIRIKKDYFNKPSDEFADVDIFTFGHKNPQGLTVLNGNIYSIEHGPQGGDEINLLNKNSNYGWPKISYGTKYNNGEGYEKYNSKYQKPLFTFLPSVAPSSMNTCPQNLKKYYNNDLCIMFLTLRDMSLNILLIDKIKNKVISVERFEIGERLRHFGIKDNKLFENENFFFISADGAGIFSAKFENFR